jgi:hypothetical protein
MVSAPLVSTAAKTAALGWTKAAPTKPQQDSFSHTMRLAIVVSVD